MTAECQDCRNRFFVSGAGTESVACPDCNGALIPERDQPGGTASDGNLRNMVDPYTQQDMGGDPGQDGIWAKTDGGFLPPAKRDESFASVKTAAHVIPEVQPGPHGIHNGVLGMLGALGTVQVNGEHVNRDTHNDMFNRYAFQSSPEFGAPVSVAAHHPAFAELAAKIIRDSHGNRDAYKDDVMALQQGVKSGQIPPPMDPVTKQPNLAHTNPIKFRNSHLEPLNQVIYTPWGVPLKKRADLLGDAKNLLLGPDQVTMDDGTKVPVSNGTVVPGPGLGGMTLGEGEAAAGAGASRFAPLAAPALKGVGKTLLNGAIRGGIAGIAQNLLNGGGDSGSVPQEGPVEAPSLQEVSHVHSFDTTPTSLDAIPESDGTGDTHEFKDQSDSLNPDNPGHDESLGGNLTPETVDLFNHLLPKLVHYFESEESGNGDPEIQHLIQRLNAEDPKFMDDDESSIDDQKQNDDLLADGDKSSKVAEYTPHMPGPELFNQPSSLKQCPSCGWYGPMSGVCPRCGHEVTAAPADTTMNPMAQYGRPLNTAKTADTQGPANPDQFRAVSEILIQQGRADEIPHMFDAPWEYADILAQVQNNQNPPPPSVAQPAQPPMDPNAMPSVQGLPPSTPTAPGGLPPSGAPGGMPPGLASIASAVSRFSADNIAPRCPECDSHTTGVLSVDGACHCHACGNQWNENVEHGWLRHADIEDTSADIDEAPDKAHDHDAIEDHQEPEAEQTWQTTDGQPLEVGQEYELHSSKYPIPDIIKIVDKGPSQLTVATTGEFADLDDQITITKQEALNEDYTFVPSAGQDPQSGTQNTDEYLNEEVGKPRQNSDPTPASAVPYTSRTADSLTPRVDSADLEGGDDKFHQRPNESLEEAMARLNQWIQTRNGQGAGGPEPLAQSPGAAAKREEITQRRKEWSQPEQAGPSLGWAPGGGGRGIFINNQLHTWPVNKTPEYPQGGLMHGEYIQQHGGPNPKIGGGFEIDPDGSVVDLGRPLTPEEQSALAQHHPDTSYGQGATEDPWGFASATGHPRAKHASDPNSIDQRAYSEIAQNGGVTIGLDGTEPTSGFAFSPFKHWEMRVPQDQFDQSFVTQYLAQHREALSQPNTYLGAWVSGNEVWMDVSQVLPDRNQALQAAAAAGQNAIYDLSTFEEIPVPQASQQQQDQQPVTSNAGLDWLRDGGIGGGHAPWEKPLPDLTGRDIFDPMAAEPTTSSTEPERPDWLMDGVQTSRLAGKRFSPNEQKKFVDEDGEARNLDKLDLEGTHYRTKDSSVVQVPGRGTRISEPDAVPDDHLVFGL